VANYYRQFNKVVGIKGEGTVDDIFTALATEIDSRLAK
jgi:adenylate kinase